MNTLSIALPAIVTMAPSNADSNFVLKQDTRKLWAGELTSLVGVEDFWFAVPL